MNSIGQIIRKNRIEKKLTQQDLAKKSNCSNKDISKFETNVIKPKKSKCEQILKSLDIDTDEINEILKKEYTNLYDENLLISSSEIKVNKNNFIEVVEKNKVKNQKFQLEGKIFSASNYNMNIKKEKDIFHLELDHNGETCDIKVSNKMIDAMKQYSDEFRKLNETENCNISQKIDNNSQIYDEIYIDKIIMATDISI